MLHIANGDSVAGSLIHSTVPGDKMAFQEDLTSGPTPAGLSASDWLRLRADFLTRAYEPADRDVLLELTKQQAALESHARDQEIVLWFAHDFNCQIHLISVLALLQGLGSSQDRLSLICIGEFPGVDPFVCLGQLDSQKLGSLFGSRHQVTDDELDLARKAWSAYCSADPSDIQVLINSDTSALPFLADALRLHLARFPSQKNGLGLIENWTLEQLSRDAEKFASLFVRFIGQYPLYGLGDTQFWRSLKRMSDCDQRLIRITGVPDGATLESIAWGPVNVEITPVGSRVLDGRDDFIELNGIDQWLGGVHLQTGKNEWRFDIESGRIKNN
jgi:hypothetical protein